MKIEARSTGLLFLTIVGGALPLSWLLLAGMALAQEPDPESGLESSLESGLESGAEPEPRPGLQELSTQERIVWLGPEGSNFPALFLAASEVQGQAILLLHDLESSADDPNLLQPLRQALAGRGWSSLSLRLPRPRKEDREAPESYRRLAEEIGERARRGLAFLRERGYQSLMVLGHGYGSFAVTLLFAGENPPAVAGFIGINPTWYLYPEGKRAQMRALRALRIPTLDVYSEQGLAVVINDATLRLNALMGSGVDLSRQVKIPYAGHYMGGMSEPLVRILFNWMRQVLPGPETERQADPQTEAPSS